MAVCTHKKLELLPQRKEKVCCTHCHLIISRRELANGYCPECYQVRGVRQYEFQEVEDKAGDKVRYRCEDCGGIVEWEAPGR